MHLQPWVLPSSNLVCLSVFRRLLASSGPYKVFLPISQKVRKLLSSFLLFIRSYGGKSRLGKKGKVLVTQSCLTLCDPMDCSPPGSSAHGILQARVLEWVTMSFSRGLPEPGIDPRSLALQADSLLSEPPGSPIKVIIHAYSSTLSQNFPVVFYQKSLCREYYFTPLKIIYDFHIKL